MISFIHLIITFRGLPFSDSTIKWLLLCLKYRDIKRRHSCAGQNRWIMTHLQWLHKVVSFRLSGDRRFETPCESLWSLICKKLSSDFHGDIILKIIAMQLSHDAATGEFPNYNYTELLVYFIITSYSKSWESDSHSYFIRKIPNDYLERYNTM